MNSSEELRESRALLSDHNKSVDNLSRAPSVTSHSDVEEKCSPSPRTPQTPQPISPAPSDMSQGMCGILVVEINMFLFFFFELEIQYYFYISKKWKVK